MLEVTITLLLNTSFIKWLHIFLFGIQEHNIYQISQSLERLGWAMGKFHIDQRLEVYIISSYILLFFQVIQRNNIRFPSKKCLSMILNLKIYIMEKKNIVIRISKDWMLYSKLLGEICYSVDYNRCTYSCFFTSKGDHTIPNLTESSVYNDIHFLPAPFILHWQFLLSTE